MSPRDLSRRADVDDVASRGRGIRKFASTADVDDVASRGRGIRKFASTVESSVSSKQ